jgi:hypothetical protein
MKQGSQRGPLFEQVTPVFVVDALNRGQAAGTSGDSLRVAIWHWWKINPP